MKRLLRGSLFTLAASLILAGCAAGAAGGGPVTSPTGKVYPPGTPPSQSRFSQAATLALATGDHQAGLDRSLEGIQADSTNPQHYYLAGSAQIGLGNYAAADSLFRIAERIYPAYEMEIEPTREEAWAQAFNEGVQAYNAGNLQEAAAAWERAGQILDYRAESFQNAAIIYTQQQEYDRAIDAYRRGLAALDRSPQTRVIPAEEATEREETRATMRESLAQLLVFNEQFAEAEQLYRQALEADPGNLDLQSNLAVALARQGKNDEATQIYTRILGDTSLSAEQLFNVGVALFNSEDYERASQAFARVTQLRPNSRDAWYNYANALYALEAWERLVPVAERLVEVDPLNENSALILTRALRDSQQNQKALAALTRSEGLPVHVEELQLRPGQGQAEVTGRVIGNKAPAGSPVRIRFRFYGDAGELGTQEVTVQAPAEDQSRDFSLTFTNAAPVVGYRYELVP